MGGGGSIGGSEGSPGWGRRSESSPGWSGGPARGEGAAPASCPPASRVPAGCLGTLGALTYGLVCFKKGDRQQSQLMMRARILAQGFTIAALMVGVVVTALKPGRGGQAVGTGTAPAAANTPP